MIEEIVDLIITTLWMVAGIAVIFGIYLTISGVSGFLHKIYTRGREAKGYTALKTVTFGDESAVTANRLASVIAVVTIFLLWGIATGSQLLPFGLPAPFVGDTTFEYTATNAAGETADATVVVRVFPLGSTGTKPPELPAQEAIGFAKNDVLLVSARRSKIVIAQKNDVGGKEEG
ncbi:MAG: ABC transporter permease, partial [Hyphomicrobiales bacterium]